MLRILLFSCILLSSIHLFAQEITPIQTDRPDLTESPSITPKRQVQVEIGFVVEKEANTIRNITHPNVLTKYGLSERVELRLVTEAASSTFKVSPITYNTFTTISPTLIGCKVNFCDELKWLPKTSLILHLGLPVLASDIYKDDNVFTTFRFLMQHTLSDKFSLSYNLGAEWDGSNTIATGIYTLALGYSISRKFGSYIELYGFAPQRSKSLHNTDMGITYLINNDIQLDMSAGIGITKESPDYFIGCGISFRTGH